MKCDWLIRGDIIEIDFLFIDIDVIFCRDKRYS